MVSINDLNASRKLDHIRIVLNEDVEGPLTTWFEHVLIPHQAYPPSLSRVDMSTTFLGKKISAPIMITGMTGGAPGTEKINASLAEAAEEIGIPMGVGSQRAALENPRLEYTFRVVRERAPSIPIVANIGAAEAAKARLEVLERAVSMIEADAIAIHLNAAQEAAQPEGSPDFTGLLERVEDISDRLGVPVMIKEVGNGLSAEVAALFRRKGIKYFDVAGAGGTNWVLIEKIRAGEAGDNLKENLAKHFIGWGIPTAASIIEVRSAAPDATIVGSGGIRNPTHVIKALALGADIAGFARPALIHAIRGDLKEYLSAFIRGISLAVSLAGFSSVNELRSKARVVIKGELLEWVRQRGLSCAACAHSI